MAIIEIDVLLKRLIDEECNHHPCLLRCLPVVRLNRNFITWHVSSALGSLMNRLADLILAWTIALFSAPLALGIYLCVRATSPGPAIYWSDRIGQRNRIFKMPKFRTMRVDTPAVATHLLADPEKALTPIGSFLRRSSLDELPQLWSILKGDMSFVGPRPALFNQYDLIELRTECGVDALIPGLTGWAQVNGRDALSIPDKVQFDLQYLQ